VDFICDGEEGPPCTVVIGKEANFTATITAGTPIRGLKHYAYVRASKYGFQMPWVGMDNEGCPYLEKHCNSSGKENLVFAYPMKVESYYPPGTYPVKYEFWAEDPHDPELQIKVGCIFTKLRLCDKNGCG